MTATEPLDRPAEGRSADGWTPDRPADSSWSLPPPERRGRTDIGERVVEKIAAQVVQEVDLAYGAPRTVFGQPLGRSAEDAPARADAHVDGNVVSLTVSMTVRWPAPVRQVAQEVRDRVTDRVTEITGLQVAEVDIDVPTLLARASQPPRVR